MLSQVESQWFDLPFPAFATGSSLSVRCTTRPARTLRSIETIANAKKYITHTIVSLHMNVVSQHAGSDIAGPVVHESDISLDAHRPYGLYIKPVSRLEVCTASACRCQSRRMILKLPWYDEELLTSSTQRELRCHPTSRCCCEWLRKS